MVPLPLNNDLVNPYLVDPCLSERCLFRSCPSERYLSERCLYWRSPYSGLDYCHQAQLGSNQTAAVAGATCQANFAPSQIAKSR